MRNPFTLQIESGIGSVFVLLLAAFFVGIIFIAVRNFNSDAIALDASQTQIKTMSSTERQLIAQWIGDNKIVVPEGKGYRYLVDTYPDRPWLKY